MERQTVYYSPAENPNKPGAEKIAINHGQPKSGDPFVWAVYVHGQIISASVTDSRNLEVLDVKDAKEKYNLQQRN